VPFPEETNRAMKHVAAELGHRREDAERIAQIEKLS
jgi:hypothetical protein